MKRSGILHAELSKLIAELRHGHMIMVTDAGFPVPRDVPCIDLAITKNVPTIEFILQLIDKEMITEKIIFAKDLRTNNPSLHKKVLSIFDDCDREEVKHTDLIRKYAPTMKCFVHTGEFSPWGNIILVAGTDPFRWFADETTVIPAFYHKRLKQIRGSKKIDLFDQSDFTRKD
ncbi:D-ribose pyranase [Treponema sp. TIM-1]|uniref:D-ribose pyranase n=1 Tax=Treponema sp. TIM-1 TaxID=2898417 RepID=UPI00397F3A9B